MLVALALLVGSTARAQDIPPEVRRPMLIHGAYGVATGVGLAGFTAGLGAAWAYGRCSDEGDGTCTDKGGVRGVAFVGAIVGYVVAAGLAIPWRYDDEGKKHQLRGRKGSVALTVVATTLATLTATAWSMAHYHDRGAAVLAPLGTAGVLSMMVAPWGLGYVTYRGSHRRAIERMISPLGFGVRF